MYQMRNRGLGQKPQLPFGPDAPSPQDIAVADVHREVRQRLQSAPQQLFTAPPELSDQCACLGEKAAELVTSVGQTLSSGQILTLGIQCETDPAAFEALLKEGGADVGSCAPWYKKPSVWIIGGAAIAAGLIVLR